MKVNEGRGDRLLRFVVGAILVLLGFFVFSQVAQIITFVIAGILIVTAITGFCGLYALLGINTCPVNKK